MGKSDKDLPSSSPLQTPKRKRATKAAATASNKTMMNTSATSPNISKPLIPSSLYKKKSYMYKRIQIRN